MKTQIPYWRLPSSFSFCIANTICNICLYFHGSKKNNNIPCDAATKPENFTVDGSINNPDVSTSTRSTRNTGEFGNIMHSLEFLNRKTIAAIIFLNEHTAPINFVHAAYVYQETKKNKFKPSYRKLNIN